MVATGNLLRRACAAAALVVLIAGCADAPAPQEPDPDPEAAFATAADLRIVHSDEGSTALFGLDLETGDSVQVTEAMGFAGFPVWSPDGGHVVFLGENESFSGLFVLDAVTGTVDPLIEGIGEPVDFSPDGSALVFTRGTDNDGRALVIHAVVTATETPIDTGSTKDAYARWSGADNALVFESARDGNPEIYRHELDSGATTRLTENLDLDEWPSPSPDGAWVAWASGSEETKNLWVMRSDGTEKRQLSEGVLFGDAFAEWSPDGSRILLSARDDNGSALYLVDVGSGEMMRVTAGTAAAWR